MKCLLACELWSLALPRGRGSTCLLARRAGSAADLVGAALRVRLVGLGLRQLRRESVPEQGDGASKWVFGAQRSQVSQYWRTELQIRKRKKARTNSLVLD